MGKVTRAPGPAAKALNTFMLGISQQVVKVGFFESAKYPDGTPIAYIATIQEFGAPSQGIPPRPFIRPTMDAEGNEWKSNFAKLSKRIVNGKMTVTQALDTIGLAAAGDIKKAISSLTSPPLKTDTLKARYRRATSGKKKIGYLSTKPLVDTGAMLAHVTHVVENK